MIKITLTTLGPGWKPAHWQQLQNEFERDLARLIGVWVQKLTHEAKQRVPTDTGQLRASIHGEVLRQARKIIGVVGTNAKHGPFVEFGTGIYSAWPGAPKQLIVAKNGKALKIPIGKFKSIRALPEAAQAAEAIGPRAVKGFVFRMSIKGSKPQPFLGPLLQEFGPQIQRELRLLCAKHGFK
jgi:hypothetical protein